MIFPGAHLKPEDLAGLIQDEKVTMSAGVPTLWMGLLQVLESGNYDISTLKQREKTPFYTDLGISGR